ncbi:MAG: efflux RND transporter periplasmic adaptor subunit [Pseudomonadota bacterium]
MAGTNSSDIGMADDFTTGKRKRKSKRGLVLVALVVLVGAGWWYWQKTNTVAEEDEPLIATVEIDSIENTIASAGTLKASRLIEVGAQVSGQLQKLHVKVGDVVEEGQLLAEIDARVQAGRVDASRASIAAQEAQLDARRAALELAKANSARQERLMTSDATSQLEYDNAVNNLAAAESSLIQLQRQIEQSRATLASDETQLEFSKIYAPAAGTIVAIDMIEGRTLNATQQAPTLMRIADLGTMTVEADISEADIASVRAGMDVYFTTLGGGNRRWYGKLRQILPTPEVLNNVVLYTGLFDIDNADGALLSEMTAQVYFITSAAENVLTVPMGALTFQAPGGPPNAARVAPAAGSVAAPPGAARAGAARGPAGRAAGGPRPATVKLVAEDGTEREQEVLVGVTSRVSAEIISGLKEGDKVVAGIVQRTTEEPAQQQNGPGNFQFRGNFR